MAAAGYVVPALLDKDEQKWSIAQVPAAAARHLMKQLQQLLAAPNHQLGRPFLTGNFAPIHSEVFTQNLPLITAQGKVHTKPLAAAAAANGSATASTQGSGDMTNGGLSSGHDGAAAPAGPEDDGDDDLVQPGDRSLSGLRVSGLTAPRLSGSGQLPVGLSGAFMRIGPNPLLTPLGGYHWFDGDGMVHAVRIKDGTASYCNRWVPTSRLKQESAAGWAMFAKLGDYVGLRGLGLIALDRAKTRLGLIDKAAGSGTANTAMVCHAARLLALNEGDMPYALRVACSGLLEAVGRVTVSGPVGKNFTAHPKLDPVTGELHFFRYTFDAAPYASYGVLGPKGDLTRSLDISGANLARPIMMHDFAITTNYGVFLDNPLCFDGERMVKDFNLPFRFKGEEGSRVGLLRRDAAADADMLWFKLPAHMVFHTVNAWEESDGTVKLFVCHHETISLNLDTRTQGNIPEGEQPRVAVITLDPATLDPASATRTASLRIITTTAGDFPSIHPGFVGRKHRWAYVATMVTGFGAAVKWDGVAKVDLWAPEGCDAVVSKIQLPAGCYNGETVFVPQHEDPALCDGEDDGYLITYVHHDETAAAAAADGSTNTGSSDSSSGSSGSSLVIWDAKSMSPQPLAVVALPQRVPYGFHALWVPESKVQQQIRGQPLQPISVV